MSEHVLKLDPPAFGPDRNFLPDAVFSEDVVMILSDGSEEAQAVAHAFASVGAAVVSIGPDLDAARRVSGIAADYGQKSLAATWRSGVDSAFDEVYQVVGPFDHFISVHTEPGSLSGFLEAFIAEPAEDAAKRSAVIVSKASIKTSDLAPWVGRVRVNAVEVDLEAGIDGPVGRAGGTFELGWAVAFFCCPFAREIDRQVLKLDGGAA